MQIYNNPQIPTQTTVPNFKAIKTIKCEGLYKKHPEYGKVLVETLRENPIAMDFCKKFDVDIVFYACKQAMSAVESSIHIFFDNPAKTKFLGIFGNKRDEIAISAYEDEYNPDTSLLASTDRLKTYITSKPIPNRPWGLLNSHITSKTDDIQKVLDEREAKAAEKLDKKTKADLAKSKQKSDKIDLDNSIEELINSSK